MAWFVLFASVAGEGGPSFPFYRNDNPHSSLPNSKILSSSLYIPVTFIIKKYRRAYIQIGFGKQIYSIFPSKQGREPRKVNNRTTKTVKIFLVSKPPYPFRFLPVFNSISLHYNY
jgi:hypothetical protein